MHTLFTTLFTEHFTARTPFTDENGTAWVEVEAVAQAPLTVDLPGVYVTGKARMEDEVELVEQRLFADLPAALRSTAQECLRVALEDRDEGDLASATRLHGQAEVLVALSQGDARSERIAELLLALEPNGEALRLSA